MSYTFKPKAEIEREKQIEELKMEIATLERSLKDTDWYAVRFAETGKSIPEAVIADREVWRLRISEIRGQIQTI